MLHNIFLTADPNFERVVADKTAAVATSSALIPALSVALVVTIVIIVILSWKKCKAIKIRP